MKTAINQLEEISADERMRELYRAREKSRLDMISKIKYAEKRAIEKGIKKGIEKGIEKGRKEEKAEIAKNLIKMGLSLEQIVEVTDLTKEEIEDIKKQNLH